MDKLQTLLRLASAREVEKVDLSEYGIRNTDAYLYIRKLSVSERNRLIELWKVESATAMDDAQRFVLTAALVDHAGRKIFDDPEADGKIIVDEWAADLVDGLTNRILKYSGLIKDGEADAEKN